MRRRLTVRNRERRAEGTSFGPDIPTRLGLLLGVTPGSTTVGLETEKLQACEPLGVSTITDLSTDGSGIFRRTLLQSFGGAVGTLPVYDAYRRFKAGADPRSALFETLAEHARDGVDFFSLHASLSRELLDGAIDPTTQRLIPLTSRGGAMMAEMLRSTGAENPLLEYWPDVLDLCRSYSITISLVGSLRPGSIGDSRNCAHLAEVTLQSSLAKEASAMDVGTMVELLNHTPLHHIPDYVRLGRELFVDAAIGALGPSPTDIAVGLDDVAGAIGAANAVAQGIEWINCVTAGEHVNLPRLEQTIQAVRYFRLALHIGEVARTDRCDQDRTLSRARAANDWPALQKAALFPDLAAKAMASLKRGASCTMCGGECPLVRTRGLQRRKMAARAIEANDY